MRQERKAGEWYLKLLWVACALLPREIRQEQFEEWRDEIQCARETGLPAARRTLSIVSRSIPQLAWRARRPSRIRREGLSMAERLGKRLPTWGTARTRQGLSLWFFAVVLPLVLLAFGFVGLPFSNEDLAREASPAGLARMLNQTIYMTVYVSLVAMFFPSLLHTSLLHSGKPFYQDAVPTGRLFGSVVLIVALVVKMVAFGQYSAPLFLAVGACAALATASAMDRRQLRRLHAIDPELLEDTDRLFTFKFINDADLEPGMEKKRFRARFVIKTAKPVDPETGEQETKVHRREWGF
jgi:hypothetical protein